MTDQFDTFASSLDAPAAGAFALIPADGVVLSQTTRALYVGIGGTIAVEMKLGGIVSFDNVPDGALLPIRVVRVLSATTASSIVGLY